jgi:predicted MPP superfamily phosphohydrolase
VTENQSHGSEPVARSARTGGPETVVLGPAPEAGLAVDTQVATSVDVPADVPVGMPVDADSTPTTDRARGRSLRRSLGGLVVLAVLVSLFFLPWWTLFSSNTGWPFPVDLVGAVLFAAALLAFPVLMVMGHGHRRLDLAARVADTTLGVVWVLFTWAALGGLLRLALIAFGVSDPARSRIVAVTVAVVAAGLLVWGNREAMRLPRIKRLDVTVPRLGRGLDGTRVVVLADTHYGPIDRAGWSARVAEAVNELDADVIVHAGDIADGTLDQRRGQAAPLGTMRSRLAKVYVTGNHEYFGEAQGWLDHMAELGWEPLHNRHIVVDRGGDSLVLAGVDDITAASSGLAGHRANLDGALAEADPELPVLLVAHQPKYVGQAASAGVDLQVSGHTHGGQIWPFNYLVRVDQPVVHGLSSHGERTQLYTSRGTGFWGPPFRIFAPSEITVLTLRAA